MNEASESNSPQTRDFMQVARAIRFALVCIILGLSYFSVRSSLSIHAFQQIFTDMLGAKPLPSITTFVIAARPVFIGISFAVPIVAVICLFARGLVLPFYIIGILVLLTIAELIVLYHGLFGPLSQIISGMSAGPTP